MFIYIFSKLRSPDSLGCASIDLYEFLPVNYPNMHEYLRSDGYRETYREKKSAIQVFYVIKMIFFS